MLKKGRFQLLFVPILLVIIACMCTNPLDIPSPEAAATAAAKVLPPGQPGPATESPVKVTAMPTRQVTEVGTPDYILSFDSTMTTMVGKEQVQSRVPLKASGGAENYSGIAPLVIVRAEGDQLSGGVCHDNSFVEEPGDFKVVSAQLIFQPGSKQLADVVLIYSLNPQVRCADSSFRPNNWNLFWMVYVGHFTHTKDSLDDSGPEPLITSTNWDINGSSASKTYTWNDSVTHVSEKTVIKLEPAGP
jgi:hypothetical protein